jgi:hypothetical protein
LILIPASHTDNSESLYEFKHDILAKEEVLKMCDQEQFSGLSKSDKEAVKHILSGGSSKSGKKPTKDISSHNNIRQLLHHLQSFRLWGTAGCLTNVYADGGGTLTMLQRLFGSKLWTLHGDEGYSEGGCCEHVILTPGDIL